MDVLLSLQLRYIYFYIKSYSLKDRYINIITSLSYVNMHWYTHLVFRPHNLMEAQGEGNRKASPKPSQANSYLKVLNQFKTCP